MSKRIVGLILLLGVSLALGIAMGEVNFGLLQKTMPPMAVSSFNQGTAHVMFVIYGAGGGVVIFIWTLLAMMLAPLFRPAAKK